jgi:hypothetical protein
LKNADSAMDAGNKQKAFRALNQLPPMTAFGLEQPPLAIFASHG